MRKNAPAFPDEMKRAANHLMEEFLRWNDVQAELRERGYPHNHYDRTELSRERLVFQAIAERFVLEDEDWAKWKWLDTPWAGSDGNTGMDACVVDFVSDAADGPSGVLGFYVAKNHLFWHALPLAEVAGAGGPIIYEANAIWDAISIMDET